MASKNTSKNIFMDPNDKLHIPNFVITMFAAVASSQGSSVLLWLPVGTISSCLTYRCYQLYIQQASSSLPLSSVSPSVLLQRANLTLIG
ncbi:hypothetical protein HAX54_012909, partial [Datura stramonium]|nr:hypothetical protein [Datura stramonium]